MPLSSSRFYLTISKSLWVALFVSYGGPYAFAAFLKVLQDCLAFLQPQLLRWLLSYISTYQSARLNLFSSPDSPSPLEGFAIAVLMFVASISQTVILHQYFQRCFETGMRVRAGLVTTIYQKALVLSNDGRGSASGDIVNLMSVDATRLQDLCTYGLIAISGPFQVKFSPFECCRIKKLIYSTFSDHLGIRLPLWHLGLAGLRWGGYHDYQHSLEHTLSEMAQGNAGAADEKQGPEDSFDERASRQYSLVSVELCQC